MIEKIKEYFKNKKRAILTLIFGPAVLSVIGGCIAGDSRDVLYYSFFLMCLAYPIFLFIFNIIAFVHTIKHPEQSLPGTHVSKLFGIMDLVTVSVGMLLSFFYASLLTISGIQWNAQWNKPLHNLEIHQPIWTGALPTVIVLLVIGVIGYIILLSRKMNETPPLVTVLCIAAMYIGATQLVLFVIQIFKVTPFEGLAYPPSPAWMFPFVEMLPLMELPFCCITMAARLIIRKIYEWNQNEEHSIVNYSGKGMTSALNRMLSKASTWPAIALIAMLPLMGIILLILSLFGQYPDHVIRAWTETAQWNLSKMQAPPNVHFDEHYLCTVAAGGHEKIVKPIRMGERHGHRIVVNRQLLVANAFEQILEEKTPKMHRVIRDFYDKHGYPIAKHIRTKLSADIIYFVMKPLELIFLTVLYLTDTAPENRIATQYMPSKPKAAR